MSLKSIKFYEWLVKMKFTGSVITHLANLEGVIRISNIMFNFVDQIQALLT